MIKGVLPCFLKRKTKKQGREQEHRGNQPESTQENNRGAHCQPGQHIPRALTSGEKAVWAHVNKHSFLCWDLAPLFSHPALHPSTALLAHVVLWWSKQDYRPRASLPCPLPPPATLSQGSCEAIIPYKAPPDRAKCTQEGLVRRNKATK